MFIRKSRYVLKVQFRTQVSILLLRCDPETLLQVSVEMVTVPPILVPENVVRVFAGSCYLPELGNIK